MTDDNQPGTILVVDDNVDVLRLAKRFLETAGHHVVTAADGEQGLAVYREHYATIVLLLTDVAMPNVDGMELADRVHGMNSNLPVLLMSGDTRSPYRGLECIAKPFRPSELLEIITRMLGANVHSAIAASAWR